MLLTHGKPPPWFQTSNLFGHCSKRRKTVSRRNKWRRRGRLEFRRETARLSDGTLEKHDILIVRIKRKACVIFGEWDGNPSFGPLYLLASTYRLGNAWKLLPIARDHLHFETSEGR